MSFFGRALQKTATRSTGGGYLTRGHSPTYREVIGFLYGPVSRFQTVPSTLWVPHLHTRQLEDVLRDLVCNLHRVITFPGLRRRRPEGVPLATAGAVANVTTQLPAVSQQRAATATCSLTVGLWQLRCRATRPYKAETGVLDNQPTVSLR